MTPWQHPTEAESWPKPPQQPRRLGGGEAGHLVPPCPTAGPRALQPGPLQPRRPAAGEAAGAGPRGRSAAPGARPPGPVERASVRVWRGCLSPWRGACPRGGVPAPVGGGATGQPSSSSSSSSPACAMRGRMWGVGGGVSTSSGNLNLWLPSSIKAISSRGDALHREGGVGWGGLF